MTDVTAYETLAKPSDAELEISRSRFLAHLARVGSEADAREVIDRVRAEHPRARHHCTAFVIGADARVQRSSDDGEPRWHGRCPNA
jgi:putative IMPACT (imprinted ancient) family translation regulator